MQLSPLNTSTSPANFFSLGATLITACPVPSRFFWSTGAASLPRCRTTSSEWDPTTA